MILALLAAVTFQPTATLDRSVAAFTGNAIGEKAGARMAVDPRLRLAACPTIALSWRSAVQDAVVVTCTGPEWRIFVPVRRAVPVPASAASPVAIAAAAVAKAEPVIRRGDPVLIEAGQDGFSITRQGFAQADATPGARVAVKVEGTVLPVQAVAVGSGRVTLPGWTR